MSASLLEVVEHYQKKVERYNDEDKILHCFDKLQKLPITVEVLSQTGIGKTVNAFRRDPGPVGTKSRELVSKWKRIFEENEKREQNKVSSRSNGDDKKRRKGGDAVKEEKCRTPSPMGSEGSDRLEIDEVTVKQEQREDEDKERRRAARAEGKARGKQEEEEKEKRRAARTKEREARTKRGAEEDEGGSESELVVGQINEIRVKEEKEEDSEHEKRLVPKQVNGTSGRAKDKDKSRKEDKSHRESDKKHSSSHKSSSSSKDKAASNHSRSSESSHSGSSKHRKEGHRKESKHKRNDSDAGDSPSDLFSVVKTEPLSSDDKHRVKEKERDKHQEKHRHEKSQSRSEKHSSSRLSESERASPSGNGVHPSSGRDRTSHPAGETPSSPPSPPASSPSKHKHKNDHSSGSKHPRESSSKHDHAERDSSREARKSKHKSSKRDKHKSDESAKASDGKASRAAPRLKEVDFLALPGSSAASDGEDAGGGGTSFADALGGMGPSKKKKKKSKSSSSTTSAASTASSTITPSTLPDVPDAPLPPPAELLDALPEVPFYRPLPRPPVSVPPSRAAAKRLMDEEEALASVLHNKNKRSKVYSGNKGTGLTRLPTLTEIALRCLQENVDYLEFTGGVPYDILRPVLERCSAAQLHNIEYYNPYLMEDTDPLWEALVKKEFKAEKRQEMETWREMHSRCSEEREHKYNKLRSLIEGKRKDALASSRKTKVAFEHTVAKPPRNVARKQAQNGTAIPVSMPTPTSQLSSGGRPSRPAPGTDPTSRPAAANRTAAPPKKKAPLMAKVLRAMGRR